MVQTPTPSCLSGYWQDAFHLKQHIRDFLQLDSEVLETKLAAAQQEMAELGHKDFDWEQATAFYRDKVGEIYLFELGAWHLSSRDYIGDTLRLIADRAQGNVLDFGGGIGTHTIAAALSPQVTEVVYCDINPISQKFVNYRIQQMGLGQKVRCCSEIPDQEVFDTIVSFDVLEHLPNPAQQLLKFHQILADEGRMILNWSFFKGFQGEHPFHLDDPVLVEAFFRTLQQHFLEVFHPYWITARCYRKWSEKIS
ncbi:MAG: class I SAM-dependent methyltransferase [Leptolyngbyaceae cyanobacterium bins.59]|nr:class I SAM-dependent methyltransferase [Leptolyngbyaceae cyanobacterium bins.59]